MEQYPDWETYQFIMKEAAQYIGAPIERKKAFENKPYPQRLFILSDLIKQFILREIGDIKLYLKLDKQLSEFEYKGQKAHIPHQHDKTIRMMMEWLDGEMDKIDTLVPQEEELVISILVWGKDYTDKMLRTTLKSLLSYGNLPAVKDHSIVIYIQTDEKTRDYLEKQPIVKKIRALGILFDYAIIPEELIKMLKGDMATYWMVGAAASLALHYAKQLKAAFHHSYPDIIYSENFFSNLFKLAKDHYSILAPAARSDEGLLLQELEKYETEDKICIPVADLMALHLNCMHISWIYKIVNNRESAWLYPASHTLIWESENKVYFDSPHLNALWLSYDVLRNIPRRYFMTLDSELDRICYGKNYYIPQEQDDMYLVEVSEQGRARLDEGSGNKEFYADYIWSNIQQRDLLKFAITGMKIPINREIRPVPANALSDEQITIEKESLFNHLIQSDPYKEFNFRVPRTHTGCFLKDSKLIPMR